MAVNLRQTHFRFGVDELAEDTHGWLAAEDANISRLPDTTFLLRFTEQETGGTAAANTDAQFQYNKNGAGWNDITTTSAVVKAVAATAFNTGDHCTQRLSGTGTFESSGKGCTETGASGGPFNDIAASGNSETECALQVVGADVVGGDVIQFRFTSPDWTVGYDVTPSLTVIANVTINAAVGLIVVSGPQASVLPGEVSIAAAVGALVVSGPQATITNEAAGVTINAAVGVLTLSGPSASVLPGEVTITASVGGLTLSGLQASVIPGAVSIAANLGQLTVSGPQATVSIAGGPQTVNANVGLLTLSGPQASISVGGDDQTINAGIGLLILSGPQASIEMWPLVLPGLAKAPRRQIRSMTSRNLRSPKASAHIPSRGPIFMPPDVSPPKLEKKAKLLRKRKAVLKKKKKKRKLDLT